MMDLNYDDLNSAVINTVPNNNFNGLFANSNSKIMPFDPFTVSISADEKEYLKTIEIAADLLASEVITPQEYFKLKMLLKSKDSEVKNTAYIFLNLKGKL